MSDTEFMKLIDVLIEREDEINQMRRRLARVTRKLDAWRKRKTIPGNLDRDIKQMGKWVREQHQLESDVICKGLALESYRRGLAAICLP